MSERHLAKADQELETAFAGLDTSLKKADYLKQVGQELEEAFAGLATSLKAADQKVLAGDAISKTHTRYKAWQIKSKLFVAGDESLDSRMGRKDALYVAACNAIAELERDLQEGKVFGVRMARWWDYTGGAFADAIVVVKWVDVNCINCSGRTQAKEEIDRHLADEFKRSNFNVLVGQLDILIDKLANVTA